jgi:hypothetical protein
VARRGAADRKIGVRDLRDFTAAQWLRLDPLVHGFKQVRNDLVLAAYLRRRPPGLDAFLAQVAALKPRVIAQVIAFEHPWALDWLLRSAARNLADAAVIVLDNSRNPARRIELERVCRERGAPYLALPPLRTRHVNRSHGMALSWAYRNVIDAVQPEIFAFLDHDLIPLDRIALRDDLGPQPFYGVLKSRRWGWHLWAGYSVFRFDAVRGRPLNFLYDFSRDLDTGGRNWRPLYRHHDPAGLRFAESRITPAWGVGPRLLQELEVIDGRWVHLRSIGYNDNWALGAEFFRKIEELTGAGMSLRELMQPPAAA